MSANVRNRDIIKLFWKNERPYRGRVFLCLFVIFGNSILVLIAPWYQKFLFDALAQLGQDPTAINAVIFNFLISSLILFFQWIFWRATGFSAASYQPHVMADLQTSTFSYAIRHSYRFFTNTFAGSLVRKVNRLSRAFEQFDDTVIFRFTTILVVMGGTFIGLYLRFPLIGFIFLGWIILVILINYLFTRWKLKADILRAEADTEASGALSDAFSNAITIKLFTGEHVESENVRGVMNSWRKAQTRSWRRGEIAFAVQTFLSIAIEIGLLWFGITLVIRKVFTIGDLVLLQSYLMAVFSNIEQVGRLMRDLFESFADARESAELLATPFEVKDARGAKMLSVKHGAVEFRDVSFSFLKSKKTLEHFSLDIKPGEKIALVGPSGAGKTTVTKLLLRFYDVQSGRILVDRQDISRVTQESLRRNISLVPQEPVLFHRSLMENIRYGRRDATDEEVIGASKKAHCHEFISDLPDNYQTLVGERGIKLSGGERQRVAIARAILKNAPILILDEATSSLDSESERLIQDAMDELMKGKTTIVIAHRLSTVIRMDRIIVVENGAVAASGTHQTLIRREGTYKKLWDIQAGGFLLEE